MTASANIEMLAARLAAIESARALLKRHRDLGEKMIATGKATLPEIVESALALLGIWHALSRGDLTREECDVEFMCRVQEALRTLQEQQEECN